MLLVENFFLSIEWILLTRNGDEKFFLLFLSSFQRRFSIFFTKQLSFVAWLLLTKENSFLVDLCGKFWFWGGFDGVWGRILSGLKLEIVNSFKFAIIFLKIAVCYPKLTLNALRTALDSLNFLSFILNSLTKERQNSHLIPNSYIHFQFSLCFKQILFFISFPLFFFRTNKKITSLHTIAYKKLMQFESKKRDTKFIDHLKLLRCKRSTIRGQGCRKGYFCGASSFIVLYWWTNWGRGAQKPYKLHRDMSSVIWHHLHHPIHIFLSPSTTFTLKQQESFFEMGQNWSFKKITLTINVYNKNWSSDAQESFFSEN